jgi:hypothetical protein
LFSEKQMKIEKNTIRKVWRYQRGNQKSLIERLKEREKQRYTKHDTEN